jgi:two-component system KDP operon response regulator KdpE
VNRPAAERPTLLVVEDDPALRSLLVTTLPAHGYRVLEAATGAEGTRLAADHVPDLALVDLGLPDLDGIEWIGKVRTWSAMPIIVLTARGQETSKVRALDAGADDYVTKPFGFPELLARIRVALRHAARPPGGGPGSEVRIGPLSVDLERRKVSVNGEEVPLTPTEYKLLVALARHAGRVMTHQQLLREVWGPHSPQENRYLRVYMTYLRRKLEPDPGRPRLFETIAGVGYRLREE